MNIARCENIPRAYRLYDIAFRAMRSTRIDRALNFIGGARGIIFALHRVRPYEHKSFNPNLGLEITPEFLDAAIIRTQAHGLAFVSLDEALARISSKDDENFAVLTFDDGYRDTVENALPVLEKHGVPATIFITSGFADRSACPWWLTLEAAIRAVPSIMFPDSNHVLGFATDTIIGKRNAFNAIRALILKRPPHMIQSIMRDIAEQAGLNPAVICDEACLPWQDIAALAKNPLIAIGGHTVSHPVLAYCTAPEAMLELVRSRALTEEHIGKPVRHFAYPNGDPSSAGQREFSMARALGFASALTTRPGLVYADHKKWTTALPRVSLNGFFQSVEQLDTMLTGVPFLLRNLGARLNVS
jgi:peptidoglycan/xylan/chitin deacetylase (PgdA/CDA1 family)